MRYHKWVRIKTKQRKILDIAAIKHKTNDPVFSVENHILGHWSNYRGETNLAMLSYALFSLNVYGNTMGKIADLQW